MQFREFEAEAMAELRSEKAEIAKARIKARLNEISQAKATLTRLEKQYQELLDKDVDTVVGDY